jgi:hypothetical protein
MLSWRDVLDQEARGDELQRQAMRWRLVQSAQPAEPRRSGRLAGSMIRLGAWMERTGCRLQSRFANIEPKSILVASGAETQLHGCS